MGIEVPQAADVKDLAIEWTTFEEPWVAAVTTRANDGSVIIVTWDEIASSVQVRWSDGIRDRMLLERETATRVSIHGKDGLVEFRIWSKIEGFSGELVIRVGTDVEITDALLRS